VVKLDRDFYRFEDFRDDFGFALFRVLDEDRVVDLEEELAKVRTPDDEHSLVQDVTDGALGVVGYSFANSRIIVAATKKPTTAPSESSKMTRSKEFTGNHCMPSLVGGKGLEVS
jgi:hypothetical protein